MRARCAQLAGLEWQVMDMMNLTFADAAFDCVIEKGMFEANLTQTSTVFMLSQLVLFQLSQLYALVRLGIIYAHRWIQTYK